MPAAATRPENDLIDANFWLASGGLVGTSETGEVLEAHDLCITNTGAPVADFNLVFPKRPDSELEETLARAAGYFEEKRLPYRVCVRADLADACRGLLLPRGFAEIKPVPGMVLSPIPEAPVPPDGLDVRPVADADALADFQRTAFEGFGLPMAAAPRFLTRRFLELPHVELFVGYAQGEAASTAALFASAGVAGIYWVATLERFRGRGFGEALTWRAVRAGRELGYPLASLQASALGRPVYARMGFAHDRDYAQFDSPKT
ncbi:MAG: GNAT family N-acetyltransferase [Myxococcota bacterium]